MSMKSTLTQEKDMRFGKNEKFPVNKSRYAV